MNLLLRGLAVGAVVALMGCAQRQAEQFNTCHFNPSSARSIEALRRIADTGYPNADSERGLGGTGATANMMSEDRGIGGSGIVGVVAGFASVCVNGYEVELTPRARITVEGGPAASEDIRLGQVVVIEAQEVAGKLEAASVDVRLAAIGPIESVAADGKTFTLLGQTVKLAGFGGSAEESLAVGEWVVVSGLRYADATIQGTSVVRLPEAGKRVLVTGELSADPNGTLMLGRLAVGAANVRSGETVVVEGIPQDGGLAAVQVTTRPTDMFSSRVRAVSVQTFVPMRETMGSIAGNAAEDMAAAELPFQIEGRIGPDGGVALNSVGRAPLPRDGLQALSEMRSERPARRPGIKGTDALPRNALPVPVPPGAQDMSVPRPVRPPPRPESTLPKGQE